MLISYLLETFFGYNYFFGVVILLSYIYGISFIKKG